MNITLMKGQDSSGNLVTLAVDADGNLISLMKGDYEGSLKTLAVDTQGRIQAVLTDPEDVFGNPSYMGAAELATRLGAASTRHRQGECIIIDDFESSTIKWETATLGASSAVARDTTYAKRGSGSISLTAGSSINDYAMITKYTPAPPTTKLGYEVNFTVSDTDTLIELMLDCYNGTNRKRAYFMYNSDDNSLAVYDHTLGMYSIGSDVLYQQGNYYFHNLKFTIDMDDYSYHKAYMNEKVYTLSAFTLQSTTDSTRPHVRAIVQHRRQAATTGTVYVDDFILTQNEP
ncbi:MAG: hypothetical protein SVV88_11620 [Pseudomonadota bacterium]|nr:hypothetical protein [Pseudomonadota bacterium]